MYRFDYLPQHSERRASQTPLILIAGPITRQYREARQVR